MAHALQHLNAWLEREAVAGERGGGGFELSIPGRETVKPSWEADLSGNRKFESISLQPSSGESRANPKKHVGDDVGKWHTSSELQRAEHGCSAQSPTPMRCARKRGNFPKSSSNLN